MPQQGVSVVVPATGSAGMLKEIVETGTLWLAMPVGCYKDRACLNCEKTHFVAPSQLLLNKLLGVVGKGDPGVQNVC